MKLQCDIPLFWTFPCDGRGYADCKLCMLARPECQMLGREAAGIAIEELEAHVSPADGGAYPAKAPPDAHHAEHKTSNPAEV